MNDYYKRQREIFTLPIRDPSPLAGEGWGEGSKETVKDAHDSFRHPRNSLSAVCQNCCLAGSQKKH